MKIKKLLLTILLTLVAILLLQAQVKAEEIDYSGYFYLLTDEGIATQLVPGAELIAGIKGEYTGEITADVTNKKITVNNFTAEELKIFDTEYDLWIEGENSVKILEDSSSYYKTIVNGNGKITTTSYIDSEFYGVSEGIYIEETEEYFNVFHLGESINNTVKMITMDVTDFLMNFDSSGNMKEDTAQKICNYLKLEGNIEYNLHVPGNVVISSSIFSTLKDTNKRLVIFNDKDGSLNEAYIFEGYNIINTNSDFRIGVVKNNFPYGDMTDAIVEDAQYVSFSNSGSFPGKVTVAFAYGIGTDGEVVPIPLYIYSYNEETKLYEYKGSDVDPFEVYNFETDYPVGKYVLTHTILPDEIISGENAKEENTNQPETNENWCVETEVDSLVWTEEDINKVLADIEETKNNTTDKKLYVHVPSGSKIPAKIFEASNGIDISIISEDGIWACFTGGSYNAIDYVAGGTISNKAIDGMVNVGEDTIVYLSLKHEGQLPATCTISYFDGITRIRWWRNIKYG